MIEIKNLNKKFKTDVGFINAVDDVSLTVEQGDIFGIIGYSGAGKSTLIRCFNLLEKYDQGSVTVEGKELKSLAKKRPFKIKTKYGYDFSII